MLQLNGVWFIYALTSDLSKQIYENGKFTNISSMLIYLARIK